MTHDKLAKLFRSRMILLRGEMKQIDFAGILDVDANTVKMWEAGGKIPNALNLYKISEACNVSIDWLLGLTDRKERE